MTGISRAVMHLAAMTVGVNLLFSKDSSNSRKALDSPQLRPHGSP